jgi:5-enolpyruvylshikimate-3-phosphate synthase
MKNAFPPVTIAFDDSEYTVPSNRVWGLIGAIEEHLTYIRLANMMLRGDIPRVKICEAMAAALRYAGAKVTAEEVSAACDVVGVIDLANTLAGVLQVAESPLKSGDEQAPDAGKPPARLKAQKT